MALLVFFAAAARAEIVASDLLGGAVRFRLRRFVTAVRMQLRRFVFRSGSKKTLGGRRIDARRGGRVCRLRRELSGRDLLELRRRVSVAALRRCADRQR